MAEHQIECACGVPVRPQDQAEDGWWFRGEENPRWVRVKVGDTTVADSRHVRTVFEKGRLPVYYFPIAELNPDFFEESGRTAEVEHKGTATFWNITVNGKVIPDAAWGYKNPQPGSEALKGYLTIDWRKTDHWYEEEEEIFVHPRDPYTRVDAIQSSRHIEVFLNGVKVADSTRPVIVFETALTPRYYLPIHDIRIEYFKNSDTLTRCPYKGIASYLSAEVNGREYKDIVWSYQDPVPEQPKIKGLWSFYNEYVDTFLVDGEPWKLREEDRLPYNRKAEDLPLL